MKVIVISVTEYTEFQVLPDGEVDVVSEDTTSYVIGSCLGGGTPEDDEQAAALVAGFFRDRPPTCDGIEDGEEEVCPVAHVSLSCVELGAPLSQSGAEWWAHVSEDPDPASVLAQIRSKRETRSKETA